MAGINIPIAERKLIKTRGKRISVTVETQYDFLISFLKRNIEYRMTTMYHLGWAARRAFQASRWLNSKSSINSIKVKGFGKTKSGTNKVHNKVMPQGNGIIFTAPMLNPLEYGRTYKGVGVDKSPYARKRHMTEPGRFILTVKFRGYLERNVPRLANAALIKAIATMEKGRGIA